VAQIRPGDKIILLCAPSFEQCPCVMRGILSLCLTHNVCASLDHARQEHTHNMCYSRDARPFLICPRHCSIIFASNKILRPFPRHWGGVLKWYSNTADVFAQCVPFAIWQRAHIAELGINNVFAWPNNRLWIRNLIT
jgi:hypothetical protein